MYFVQLPIYINVESVRKRDEGKSVANISFKIRYFSVILEYKIDKTSCKIKRVADCKLIKNKVTKCIKGKFFLTAAQKREI